MRRRAVLPTAITLLLVSGVFSIPAVAGLIPGGAAPMPAAAPDPTVHGAWSLFHAAPQPPPPQPDPSIPGIRMLHTAVYDPVGARTIVHGGLAYDLAYNDTWVLSSSGQWSQLAPLGVAATSRRDHTAILDPVRNRMVVFGGWGYANPYMNEVQVLSLGATPTWSNMATSGTPPPGRFSHTAIYDPPRDRMIVFGGYNGAFLGDVWQLTFSGTPTWSQIFPTGAAPGVRNALTAIYDPVRDRMLLFGGWNGTDFRADVWALNLSGPPAWTRLLPAGTGPSPRRHYVAVYDPARDRIVVSGGESWSGYHDDSFALSLSGTPTWSAIAAGGTLPTPRAGHRAVLDAAGDRMIVFGGYDLNYRNDAHALALAPPATWSAIEPVVPPPPSGGGPTARRDHVAAYDPVRDRMLIFGGWDGTFRNDVWALTLAGTPEWVPIVPTGTPPSPRFAHAAAYDAANDRLVVFGGYDGTFRGDVWALSLSGTPAWSQLLPSGTAPGVRNALTAFYDPVRQRMLLFGGWDGGAYRDEVWAMSLSGPPVWTQLATGNGPAPSARRHYAGIYDPLRDELVVFGGLDGAYVNDTWALSLSNNNWHKAGGPQRQAPGGRDAARGVYDTLRDRMIVFGGYDGQYLQDAWQLALSNPSKWSALSPQGTLPEPRLLHTAIYDPIRDRVLVHGGEGFMNELFGETWALDFSSASQSGGRGRLELEARPSDERGLEFALSGVRPNPWTGNDRLTVAFSLPGRGPASLELFTVSGQRVLTREVGSLGGGAHLVPLDPGARLAPGLYMLRLSSSKGSVSTKVAKLD